ncbi:hypothetical protein AB5I41_12135 [Sphingomonas sp. MMS24-JH45]
MLGFVVLTTAAVARDDAIAADGGGGCGGKLIEDVPFNVNGQQVGQLQFYYNAQNGNNCAVMYHGGPSWRCAIPACSLPARPIVAAFAQAAFERENYRYQAGPIRTVGRDRCVYAGGGIDWGGQAPYALHRGALRMRRRLPVAALAIAGTPRSRWSRVRSRRRVR